jgi:hypothetical protein
MPIASMLVKTATSWDAGLIQIDPDNRRIQCHAALKPQQHDKKYHQEEQHQ